jgi:uncharacterized protein YjbJ (UPF0337 family)
VAGRLDRAKGRVAEALGALMDNKRLKDKGRVSRVKGTTKNKLGRAVDAVRQRTP